jgi:hypothetical protein
MPTKRAYLVLCILGVVLPYRHFLPWLMENGLNLKLLIEQLAANRVSLFFGTDVMVSALAVLVLVRLDGARFAVKHRWAPIVALFTVGVSLALPLFLYLREDRLDAKRA